MSVYENMLVLETASELIDTLPNGSMRKQLIEAVKANDLETVHYLNQSVIGAVAHYIRTDDPDWGDPAGDFTGASEDPDFGGR